MTNFADLSNPAISGKHNMASTAFQALREARAHGTKPDDGVSFDDLVDTINPLQHIPVVSTLYREMTGDDLSPQARMAGGAIYGGPIGFVTSMIDSAIDAITGDDIGGHIYASLFGESKTAKDPAQAKLTAADTNVTIPPPPDIAMTGSIAKATTPSTKPAKADQAPPSALPQLSPEAFSALLGSFSDPASADNQTIQAEKHSPAINEASTNTPEAIAQNTASKVARPATLFESMSAGLEQLEALKSAKARNLSLGASAQPSMANF